MPVTFKVSTHSASPYTPRHNANRAAGTEAAFLREATRNQYGCVIQSSLKFGDPNTAHLVPRKNGFVNAIIDAYGSHHHLRIRPDDVWLAILTQLSFYVNAHAEELRQYFVSYEGKRSIELGWLSDGEDIARQAAQAIHKNVVDSTLVEWILPDFTTTTIHDRTVCSVVMMSTLKAYFDWRCSITCGIPSVTLEGTKSDWEEIYRRIDRLYELGQQPSSWAEMLRPILRRFVSAFDGQPDIGFWNHVLYSTEYGCGEQMLSGWITAFCVWNREGKWQLSKAPNPSPNPIVPYGSETDTETEEVQSKRRNRKRRRPRARVQVADTDTVTASRSASKIESPRHEPWNNTLDGVEFFAMDIDDVPPGFCEVDVTFDDNSRETTRTMLAGHIAYSVSSTQPEGPLDTIQPSPHWFLVEKGDPPSLAW